MNRLVMVVLKNIFRVPGLYGKLCRGHVTKLVPL